MATDARTKKEKVWLYIVVPVILFNALPLFVFGAFFAAAFQRSGGSDAFSNVDTAQPLFWLYVGIAILNLGMALFVIAKLNREGTSIAELLAPGGRIFQFEWKPDILLFIAFNLIFALYIAGYILLTGQWPSYRGLDDWQRIIFIVLFPILAGFAEELFWRGFIIRRLQSQGHTARRAIMFSAIGFALIHGVYMPDKLLITFLIGLLNGFYYVREQRLVPLMFAHAFVDTWTFGLSLFL